MPKNEKSKKQKISQDFESTDFSEAKMATTSEIKKPETGLVNIASKASNETIDENSRYKTIDNQLNSTIITLRKYVISQTSKRTLWFSSIWGSAGHNVIDKFKSSHDETSIKVASKSKGFQWFESQLLAENSPATGAKKVGNESHIKTSHIKAENVEPNPILTELQQQSIPELLQKSMLNTVKALSLGQSADMVKWASLTSQESNEPDACQWIRYHLQFYLGLGIFRQGDEKKSQNIWNQMLSSCNDTQTHLFEAKIQLELASREMNRGSFQNAIALISQFVLPKLYTCDAYSLGRILGILGTCLGKLGYSREAKDCLLLEAKVCSWHSFPAIQFANFGRQLFYAVTVEEFHLCAELLRVWPDDIALHPNSHAFALKAASSYYLKTNQIVLAKAALQNAHAICFKSQISPLFISLTLEDTILEMMTQAHLKHQSLVDPKKAEKANKSVNSEFSQTLTPAHLASVSQTPNNVEKEQNSLHQQDLQQDLNADAYGSAEVALLQLGLELSDLSQETVDHVFFKRLTQLEKTCESECWKLLNVRIDLLKTVFFWRLGDKASCRDWLLKAHKSAVSLGLSQTRNFCRILNGILFEVKMSSLLENLYEYGKNVEAYFYIEKQLAISILLDISFSIYKDMNFHRASFFELNHLWMDERFVFTCHKNKLVFTALNKKLLFLDLNNSLATSRFLDVLLFEKSDGLDFEQIHLLAYQVKFHMLKHSGRIRVLVARALQILEPFGMEIKWNKVLGLFTLKYNKQPIVLSTELSFRNTSISQPV